MELIVKINSNPGDTSYKDGDVVQAFSQDRIYKCHAEEKCNVVNFDLDPVTGLRPNDSLLMKFLEKTNLYKFERVNSNEVLRTNLVTNAQDTLSTVANADGERINAYQYLSRRLKNPKHKIFGSSGREIWYGKSRTDIDLDAIWNDIETHTDYLKSDHTSWPLTPVERMHFLPMNACMHGHPHDHNDLPGHAACMNCTCGCDLSECSEEQVEERNLPVVRVVNEGTEEQDSVLVAKRKFQVPYWDFTSLLAINVDDVRDLSKEVDARKVNEERPAVDLLTVDKVVAGIVIL